MRNKGKLSIVLLFILLVASLALAGAGFYLFQKEQKAKLTLQEELNEAVISQRRTEAKLEETKRLMLEGEFKLEKAKTQITTLTSDLEQERTARLEALTNIEQLKVDLTNQQELRSDLESRLNQAEGETQNLRAQLKELEAEKVKLEAQIKELPQEEVPPVELGEIVVSPESPVAAGKEAKPVAKKKGKKTAVTQLEGKVLVINKDYNFAVIDLGEKDGLKVGDLFSVYHKNKHIGDVKIEKIHESMSAAGFVSLDIKNKINEGDRVVQKKK